MTNYQPTSAPYSADNLPVHETDLAWVREFGTETTEATGQAFSTSGASTVNTVNGRMGMLECLQDADSETMSGTTFLIPPWSTYADSPILGPDSKAICLIAHFFLPEANLIDPESPTALLILAAEDFVGNVDSNDVSAVAIRGRSGREADAIFQNYGNGAGSDPTNDDEVEQWGTDLYVRLVITGDVAEEKESEALLWLARDGLSWTPTSSGQITADGTFRRIGLGVTGGPGKAWLDWVRIYNYPLAAISEQGVLSPPLPLTGGRRF